MTEKLHVQIALVGGSPTPVYQGIVHLHPDQVVLICSKESKKQAESVKAQLQWYQDKDVMIYEVSDTDLTNIYIVTETIESTLPKDIRLSINVSGGMKLWTAIFTQVFETHRPNCELFVIGQGGVFYDLRTRQGGTKVAFDKDVQFKLLGHELNNSTPLSDYTQKDINVLNQVKRVASNRETAKDFRDVTKAFLEKYNLDNEGRIPCNGEFALNNNTKLSWVANTSTFKLQIANTFYSFSSEHVEHIVLNTGWFELYVAKLIGEKYGTNKVWLNCVFKNSIGGAKNEIDIIADTGDKLIFVECKTNLHTYTDIDKFKSAVHNFGGLGSMPLFVTYWKLDDVGKEKCQDNSISTFCIREYYTEKMVAGALSQKLDELNKKWNI